MKRLCIIMVFGFCTLAVCAQWTVSGTNIHNANTGNVGIGTTTPAYKLAVNGIINTPGTVGGGGYRINSFGQVASRNWLINTDIEGYGDFGIRQSTTQTGSTFDTKLYISPTGSVGIGNTAPAYKLDVNGTGRFTDLITSQGATLNTLTTNSDLSGSVTLGRYGPGQPYSLILLGSTSSGYKFMNASVVELMTIESNGKVGIGTTTPSAKLSILGGGIRADFNALGSSLVLVGTNSNFQVVHSASMQNVGVFNSNGGVDIRKADGIANIASFNSNGNVLIGKTSQVNTSYMLDINGNVRANRVTVNTTGADFVFESNYKLIPLDELEKFVKSNHHLPGIASAAKMQKEGLELSESHTNLLQKIEELTLYIIEMNKKIDAQQIELNKQKKTDQ